MIVRPVLCLLALLCIAPDASADESPGPTARFFSQAMIEGLQLGVSQNENAAPAVKDCIRAVDGDALAPAFEALLATTFTVEERAEADAFNASALGKTLHVYARQNFRLSHGIVVDDPITLSEDDHRGLRAFGETPGGRKFVALYTREEDAPEEPQVIALHRIVEDCEARR